MNRVAFRHRVFMLDCMSCRSMMFDTDDLLGRVTRRSTGRVDSTSLAQTLWGFAMRRHSSRWVLVFLTVVLVTPARAQRLSGVPSGTHMRIVTCTGTTIVGKFGGIRSDSVELALDSVVTSTVTFPPERIPRRIVEHVPRQT